MSSDSPSEVTRILEAVRSGDRSAQDRLLQLVHAELRAMARNRMSRERAGHTLQPTALINEAYLRLARGDQRFENRAHFFGAAAEAMRQVLIEHARRRSAQKRGGEAARVTFNELNVRSEEPDIDLLALDEALEALISLDRRLGEMVRLRYFCGLTIGETAQVMGLAPATVKRDWAYARAWLHDRMMGE